MEINPDVAVLADDVAHRDRPDRAAVVAAAGRQHAAHLEQRGRVFDLMVEQTPENRQRFFNALRSTNQGHVACFIERNGRKYIL